MRKLESEKCEGSETTNGRRDGDQVFRRSLSRAMAFRVSRKAMILRHWVNWAAVRFSRDFLISSKTKIRGNRHRGSAQRSRDSECLHDPVEMARGQEQQDRTDKHTQPREQGECQDRGHGSPVTVEAVASVREVTSEVRLDDFKNVEDVFRRQVNVETRAIRRPFHQDFGITAQIEKNRDGLTVKLDFAFRLTQHVRGSVKVLN
jgi:hypothetical protein